ncbi:hypothetical protein HDU86_004213 [Geranomyces michiganensis]|nr:hypothetical protein HDU86_004213 [Geranomyces michiganensis]
MVGYSSSFASNSVEPLPAAQTAELTLAPTPQVPPPLSSPSTSPFASPSPTADPSTVDDSSHLAVGPIVGGASGGVVFLAFLVACIVCGRRKRRRRHVYEQKPFVGPGPLGASATAVDVREDGEDVRQGDRMQDPIVPNARHQQTSGPSRVATGEIGDGTASLLATTGPPSSGASTPQGISFSSAVSPQAALLQSQQPQRQHPLPPVIPLGAGSSQRSSAASSQSQDHEPHLLGQQKHQQQYQQQQHLQQQMQQQLHPSSAAASRLSSTTTADRPQRLSTAGSSSAAAASSTSGPSSGLGRSGGTSSTSNHDDNDNNDDDEQDTPDRPPPAYETLATPRTSSAGSAAVSAPPPPTLVAHGIPGKNGFLPSAPDEIPLHNGDEVTVLRLFSDGWCRVRNIASGAVGMVPAKFVVAEPAARRPTLGGGYGHEEGSAMAGPSRVQEEDDLEMPRDVKRGYADPYRPVSGAS